VEAASLKSVSAFLKRNPETAIINHPDKVLLTTRDKNCRRLNKIAGVRFPLTVRMIVDQAMLADPVKRVAELGFDYPVLVRNIGTQTGRTFVKADTPDRLCQTIAERKGEEIYLIQYIETLFRETCYRKMRAFFIGGRIYPVVCHIDDVWNVHGFNRTDVMAQNPWMMDEEKSYLADPRKYLGDTAYEILEELNRIVGLDFTGVDFTIMDDGTFLIYELNPAMRHSFDHARKFPYLRPYFKKISQAFSNMTGDKIAKKVEETPLE
jgi:glutathione synthase/RimK-type ligase-like ATP-grasp enzyme